uniref:Uncharacterized protein n=1 Tax=Myotis lucifugus TaxID=59463 RepID=G1Q8Q3_MYOLU
LPPALPLLKLRALSPPMIRTGLGRGLCLQAPGFRTLAPSHPAASTLQPRGAEKSPRDQEGRQAGP